MDTALNATSYRRLVDAYLTLPAEALRGIYRDLVAAHKESPAPALRFSIEAVKAEIECRVAPAIRRARREAAAPLRLPKFTDLAKPWHLDLAKGTYSNLGEAAAFVFLESAASALKRGAPPWATVLGSGMSNDAHHCSAPEPPPQPPLRSSTSGSSPSARRSDS